MLKIKDLPHLEGFYKYENGMVLYIDGAVLNVNQYNGQFEVAYSTNDIKTKTTFLTLLEFIQYVEKIEVEDALNYLLLQELLRVEELKKLGFKIGE